MPTPRRSVLSRNPAMNRRFLTWVAGDDVRRKMAHQGNDVRNAGLLRYPGYADIFRKLGSDDLQDVGSVAVRYQRSR